MRIRRWTGLPCVGYVASAANVDSRNLFCFGRMENKIGERRLANYGSYRFSLIKFRIMYVSGHILDEPRQVGV